MSKIPEFRVWYDNKMWCLAKLDLWGDPDQAICDLAPYLPKYEELYDIYLSDVILMQYTGLKDKNGVEIFEGDAVAIVDGKYGNKFDGAVSFKNASYVIESSAGTHYRWMDYDVEIIGNIHENPELLEVGEHD